MVYNLKDVAQEEGTFYLVGADALVDNTEMVHHYVVKICTTKIDEEMNGLEVESDGQSLECTKLVWGWAPGGKKQTCVKVQLVLDC